jgi:hypothetical protein
LYPPMILYEGVSFRTQKGLPAVAKKKNRWRETTTRDSQLGTNDVVLSVGVERKYYPYEYCTVHALYEYWLYQYDMCTTTRMDIHLFEPVRHVDHMVVTVRTRKSTGPVPASLVCVLRKSWQLRSTE